MFKIMTRIHSILVLQSVLGKNEFHLFPFVEITIDIDMWAAQMGNISEHVGKYFRTILFSASLMLDSRIFASFMSDLWSV